MLEQFPFLYDFAETKIHAALILDSLNKDPSRIPIQPAAVLYELAALVTEPEDSDMTEPDNDSRESSG